MKKKVLLLIALAVSPAAFGKETGAAFLKMDPGVRSAALGGNCVIPGAFSSLEANPAAMADSPKKQLSMTHAAAERDMSLGSVAWTHPRGRSVWGAGFVYLANDGLEGRGADRRPAGSFGASDGAFSVGAARRGAAGSFGWRIKAIQQKIAARAAWGAAIDVGGAAHLRGGLVQVGWALQNAGPRQRFEQEYFDLPLTAAAGAAVNVSDVSFVFNAGRRVYARETELSLGTEYRPQSALALRASYQPLGEGSQNVGRGSGIERMSLGLGLNVLGYRFDYAWAPWGQWGWSQRFALAISF